MRASRENHYQHSIEHVVNEVVRRRNGQLLDLTALAAEHESELQQIYDRMVPVPDPTRCCWPRCIGPISRRYGIPLCDVHATAIASRIQNIDATKPLRSLHVDAEVVELRQALARKTAQLALIEEMSKRGKPQPPTAGWVYFVQVGGHIKIGWTSDLTKRMRAYPPNAVLLAAHPGLRKDESRLHKRFAVHRSHGREWYPLVPVILDHIKRVIAEHGPPDDVTFGAKPTEVPRPYSKAGQPHIKGWPINGTPKVLRG